MIRIRALRKRLAVAALAGAVAMPLAACGEKEEPDLSTVPTTETTTTTPTTPTTPTQP